MIIEHEGMVTDAVVGAMENTRNRRLKELMEAFVRHAHAFVREVGLTEEEFEQAAAVIAELGHHTHDKSNEVILAADVLGISSLVKLINNPVCDDKTSHALLGPFWRANAPMVELGGTLLRCATPGPTLLVSGRVVDEAGEPIPGALVDVWQSSPVGLYENQTDEQVDMNLRGRVVCDPKGQFWFRSVKPAGYPVPTSGPIGRLLRAQNRHPYRPAHMHFMVSAEGFRTLVTQIFSDDSDVLNSDVTFSVIRQLVGTYARHDTIDTEVPEDVQAPYYTLEYEFRLEKGERTFPLPPIP